MVRQVEPRLQGRAYVRGLLAPLNPRKTARHQREQVIQPGHPHRQVLIIQHTPTVLPTNSNEVPL
jgi:hypothetical protein